MAIKSNGFNIDDGIDFHDYQFKDTSEPSEPHNHQCAENRILKETNEMLTAKCKEYKKIAKGCLVKNKKLMEQYKKRKQCRLCPHPTSDLFRHHWELNFDEEDHQAYHDMKSI